MNTQRTPSQTDGLADGMWLEVEGDLDSYLTRHDVLPPDETTPEDFPEMEMAIRTVDEEALERELLEGKWVFDRPPRVVDDLWGTIEGLVDEVDLYSAKVSTAFGNRMNGDDDHVVCIYTPNYFDRDDVFRAREVIREECGVDEMIYYRPEIYSADGRRGSDHSGSYRYSG